MLHQTFQELPHANILQGARTVHFVIEMVTFRWFIQSVCVLVWMYVRCGRSVIGAKLRFILYPTNFSYVLDVNC